jgi:hypothetical protein
VRQNKEVVAIVPLISQYIYGDATRDEFANYDTPTPYFAIKNDDTNINRVEIAKFIHREIDEIARITKAFVS